MIGFYRCAFIGDNVIALHALYALRVCYPDESICIYTNTEGMQIFQPFAAWLADENPGDGKIACIDTEIISKQELLAHINAQDFSSFILTQPNRWRCKLLYASKVKRIITLVSPWNLPRPRFEKLLFSRKFSRFSYQQALLKLVRMIDKSRYDSAHIDFSRLQFPINAAARSRVLHALYHALESTSTYISIDSALDVLPDTPKGFARAHAGLDSRIDSASLPPIISLNPFVRSSQINLPLHAHIALATHLAHRFPTALILLLTHKGAMRIAIDSAPESSAKSTNSSATPSTTTSHHNPPPNLKIFQNDENLANLIELLRLSSLFISPSTGPIHIANVLRIPIIGIYNHKDAKLWLGDAMKREWLLLLETPCAHLTQRQCHAALESAKSLCECVLHELGIVSRQDSTSASKPSTGPINTSINTPINTSGQARLS